MKSEIKSLLNALGLPPNYAGYGCIAQANEDFEAGHLFRDWMASFSPKVLTEEGHIQCHPTMWYNLGRWAMYLNDTNQDNVQKGGTSGNWGSGLHQSEQGAWV